MNISRETLIKRLSERSGYWQKDIRAVLQHLDDVVFEYLDEVDDDEEVVIQLVKGIRCGCKVVPPRQRVDPRDGSPITVKATVKPVCKFSDDFRSVIQNQYEEKKDG